MSPAFPKGNINRTVPQDLCLSVLCTVLAKRPALLPVDLMFILLDFYDMVDSPATQGSNHTESPPTRHQAKRVILRLPVNDFTGGKQSEYDEAIIAYLA
jgi:hypothetical protein